MRLLLDDFTIQETESTTSDLSKSRERTWLWYNIVMAGLGFGGTLIISLFSVDFSFPSYSIALIFLGIGLNIGYWCTALAEISFTRFFHSTPQLLTWLYFGLSLALNLYFLFSTAKEYAVL